MATAQLFTSFTDDVLRGNINVATDTFYAMIVGASYTPNKNTHTKRSDVTNEVTGTGYTAGGKQCTLTITKDTANSRVQVAMAALNWATSTIANAQKCVVYKRRGGAASADELVGYIDNGAPVSTSAGTLSQAASAFNYNH